MVSVLYILISHNEYTFLVFQTTLNANIVKIRRSVDWQIYIITAIIEIEITGIYSMYIIYIQGILKHRVSHNNLIRLMHQQHSYFFFLSSLSSSNHSIFSFTLTHSLIPFLSLNLSCFLSLSLSLFVSHMETVISLVWHNLVMGIFKPTLTALNSSPLKRLNVQTSVVKIEKFEFGILSNICLTILLGYYSYHELYIKRSYLSVDLKYALGFCFNIL